MATSISNNLPEDRDVIPLIGPLPTHRPNKLDIFHPNIPRRYAGVLLTFLAASNGGVSYPMVYYSCCIVAGNCWEDHEGIRPDGTDLSTYAHLSTSHKPVNDPGHKPFRPTDGIINVDQTPKLYFHVPKDVPNGPRTRDPELGYPITSCFEHWVFPSADRGMPKPWRDLPAPDYDPPDANDMNTCKLTGHSNGLESAHIIPAACDEWFNQHDMATLTTASMDKLLDSPSNVFPLRADIHALADASVLVPMPKPIHGSSNTHLFMCVALQPANSTTRGIWELIHEFHNRRFRPIRWVCREYLFARFAWTIFCTARMPLLQGLRSKKNGHRDFYLSLATDDGVTEEKRYTGSPDFPWPRTGYSNKSGISKSSGSLKRGRSDDNQDNNDDVSYDHRQSQSRIGMSKKYSGPVSDDSDGESDGEHKPYTKFVNRQFPPIVDHSVEDSDDDEPESWADYSMKLWPPIVDYSVKGLDSEPEPMVEYLRRHRMLKRASDSISGDDDNGNDEAGEEQQGGSPKRPRHPDHSGTSHKVGQMTNMPPPHPPASDDGGNFQDLAASFSSSGSSEMSTSSKMSKSSKSSTSTKGSKDMANRGIKILPMIVSEDSKNSSDIMGSAPIV